MQKRINGGNMKNLVIGLTAIFTLTACDEAPQPDGYFDHVNPIPTHGQPIDPQPIAAPPLVSSDGTETLPSDVPNQAETEIQATSKPATPAPGSGLYEPSLTAPEEDGKSKKKKRKDTKPVKVDLKPRNKTLNLREYAATQTQLVGEKKYARTASKYSGGGNCDQYSIPEIAQIAFLNAGGPKRDTLLLDADGDGFACAWVPQR